MLPRKILAQGEGYRDFNLAQASDQSTAYYL